MNSLESNGHVIEFEHGIREILVRSNKKQFNKLQPTTTCTLRTNDGEVITSATVGLYHKDNNESTLAIRHAFKKAVNNLDDVNTRRMLWEDIKPHIL